ncbi:MAG: 50S ribosomal protein L25 [Dehalococcoidia bacterium]
MNKSLQIEKRTIEGKKVKTLRTQGITPIHLYGSGIESLSMQADFKDLISVLNDNGFSIPITLNDGENDILVFARNVQRHPLTEEILHVDFQVVSKDDEVEIEVPINLSGESPAVKNFGGILIKLLETIKISSKVDKVPESIELDIAVLESLEQSLLVSEIEVPEGVKIITDETFAIARVIPPRIEVEEELDGDEEISVDGESSEEDGEGTEDSETSE